MHYIPYHIVNILVPFTAKFIFWGYMFYATFIGPTSYLHVYVMSSRELGHMLAKFNFNFKNINCLSI